MRKFAKIALIVCLVVAAVPAALFASLWLWFQYQTAKVDDFYRDNRLFGVMREVEKQSTNDSMSARASLLQMIPLGSDRDTVIAFLRKEGLGCRAKVEPIADTELQKRLLHAQGLTSTPNDSSTRKEWVDCQAVTPSIMGHKQWIVSLEFDTDTRLSDARVAIWNIFL